MSLTDYQELESIFRRLGAVKDALAVLYWDSAAVMPSGGAQARSEQLAVLEVLSHEILTNPRVSDLLGQVEADAGALDAWQMANLREMRRVWIHATALDATLVDALSRARSACETEWRAARQAGDFEQVKPKLAALLALVREVAAAKGARLNCGLYDALLDEYEPGGSSAEIDRLFDDLADFLPDFRDKVLARQAKGPAPIEPQGPFPVSVQKQLGESLMAALGFDFNHGRLDTSLHPFCGGIPDDVRITTRYDESRFTKALMGVIHETGHALYERGLPGAWRNQPVGVARGMSIHESQSLLMEMQACRSAEFLRYLTPLARRSFGGSGPAWEEENLHRLYTRVNPDFIRVDADEVTYPSHVILRYRLEKSLIEGQMALDDLPTAWNQGMKDLLGIVPPTDREGCLQDIHWFDGAWGYFPTYTLGAMTAAQFFDAAKRANPDILPAIEQGDFVPLVAWLKENVHSQASSLSASALITKATGRPLDAAVFKEHLRQRYLN